MCSELHIGILRRRPVATLTTQDINNLQESQELASWVQFPKCPHAWGKSPGCTLTTLFGTIEYKEVSEVTETPRKKYGWLPLLTVLFMISYGLMTMLIVEQGQTIESQRALIRELFRDSSELSATKMKAVEERNQAARALAQNPSSQNPSTQAPSSQAGPQQRAQNQAKPKADFQMPSKPAADLADHRRALVTI